MYQNPGAVLGGAAGAGAGAGVLATTGWDALWLPMAGFALVAAGMALLRTMPRRAKDAYLD